MGLLRNRNYLILYSGQLVSTVGNNLFAIALPWYVLMLTGSKSALALTGVAQSIPVVIGLFVGVWVDRWRKKQTMIVSDILRGILSLLLFCVAMFWHPSVLWVVALVLLMQCIGTVFNPASMAMLPQVVEKADLPAATGLEQSGSAIASLGGMLGGGALLTLIGAPLLFLGNAVSFFVSVFSLFFVKAKEKRVERDRTDSHFIREWLDGLRVVWKSKLIRRITLAAILTNFGGAPMNMVLVAWVKYTLGGKGYMLGLLSASALIGVIIGGVCLGAISKRIPLQRVLLMGLLMIGISLAMTGLVSNLYWAMVWVFISGLAEGVLNGSLGAMAVQVIPEHMMGRVVGTLQSSMSIAQPLGMAVFGFLMVKIPLVWLFVLLGLCPMIGGLSFLIPATDDTDKLANVTA